MILRKLKHLPSLSRNCVKLCSCLALVIMTFGLSSWMTETENSWWQKQTNTIEQKQHTFFYCISSQCILADTTGTSREMYEETTSGRETKESKKLKRSLYAPMHSNTAERVAVDAVPLSSRWRSLLSIVSSMKCSV